LTYDETVVVRFRTNIQSYQGADRRSTGQEPGIGHFRLRTGRPLLLLLLFLFPARALAGPGDRLALFQREDPENQALSIPGGIQDYPDSGLRLLIFRNGSVVLDRGLRDTRSERAEAGAAAGKTLFPDSEILETVEISPDDQSGVLVRTWIRPPGKDGSLSGNVSVAWIDPDHPRGRWSLPLPPDRFVEQAHVLDQGRGIALMTATPEQSGIDFTLYDRHGDSVYHLDAAAGSVLDFRATRAGAFLGLEIAFPEDQNLPEMGILVLDRLQNGSWIYTWSYGDDREPVEWTLRDDGVLEIRTPGRSETYDRTGRPLIPRNRKGRRLRSFAR